MRGKTGDEGREGGQIVPVASIVSKASAIKDGMSLCLSRSCFVISSVSGTPNTAVELNLQITKRSNKDKKKKKMVWLIYLLFCTDSEGHL